MLAIKWILKKCQYLTLFTLSLVFLCSIAQAQPAQILDANRYLFAGSLPNNSNPLTKKIAGLVYGRATLYKSLNSTIGTVEIDQLPNIVKQNLFRSTTYNPFKAAYAYLYTSSNLEKLKSCSFVGVPFELDNNSKTQEWFISTSLYGCLKGQVRGDGGGIHSWVLQQDSQNKSRVLMESDGPLSITKTPQDKAGYRQMRTEHYVIRFAPQEKIGCGKVLLKWGYNGKQYKILEQGPIFSADCPGDWYSADLSKEENAQRKHQAATQVKAAVNRWLPTLKAFR
ncbi:hypothetical protein [Thiofilum flexile]|uniref:hypothetical protein n=1 Tax=Thiofilum flexile TaxID=125627 RepID=UPI0003750AD8|nr:hypothetical protein [Thiofilum flexile]